MSDNKSGEKITALLPIEGELTALEVSNRVKGWITDRTVKNWVKRVEFNGLFSANVLLNQFTHDDLIIVNTIVHLRELNQSFADIATQLKAGFRVHELQQKQAPVEVPRSMETKFLNEKIEDLQGRLETEEKNTDTLLSEIRELREMIGFYKGVMKAKGVSLDNPS